jgi:hypothetical protein
VISQTGIYLMPATTGFYPEVKPKDSHTLSRAVQSALRLIRRLGVKAAMGGG